MLLLKNVIVFQSKSGLKIGRLGLIPLIFTCCLSVLFMPATLFANTAESDSMQQVQEVLDRLATIPTEDAKLDSLIVWGRILANEDLAKSLIIAKIGIERSQKLPSRLSDFIMLAGRNFANWGLIDDAESYFLQYISLAEQENDQKNIAAGKVKMSFVHRLRGDFDAGLIALMDALKINEELGDERGQADVLTDLSNIMIDLSRYAEGITYGRRAIEMLDDENHELMLTIHELIAYAHIGLGDYEEALVEIKKGLALAEKINADRFNIGTLQNTAGNVYKFLKEYDKALKAYSIAERISKELEIPAGMIATSGNIADIFSFQGELDKELAYRQQCIRIIEKYGINDNVIENIGKLSTAFEKLHQYDSALYYRNKHLAVYDSLLSLDKDRVTKELTTKYETEKKEAMITLQQEKLSRQRIAQFLGFGLFALALGFLFMLFRNYRQKQKSNAQLEEANQLLETKNKENELLLKEIHHRVKNNLQTISSLLSLQSRSINDPSALDAVNESKNRVASMALIHQKLYQRDNLSAIEMRDYFQTIGKTILKSFGSKAKHISLNVNMNELELDVDTAVPIGLITNELITNSIKHAFPDQAEGKIDVSIKANDNEYQLRIKDNGVGGELQHAEKENSGFGNMLVNILTQQLGGTIQESIDHGRSTIISFPITEQQAA